MKKILSIILFVSIVFSLASCKEDRDAYLMMSEFISLYGAEGIIYSPTIDEGEDGYICDGLIEKMYNFSGEFPENYAIFLSGHTDSFSECAIFICDDADMLDMAMEMSIERIKLLSGGEIFAFVRKSRNICFYSTMSERERAEKIFSEIIR